MQNTELILSAADDAHVIRNLWPLYQHDVSAFDQAMARPNRHGLFGVDDAITTLAELGENMGAWWREPGALFPYLIRVDGKPAGFNLIAARSRLPNGPDADFVVHEFFVLHAYRGTGVAEQAARLGFERHRGSWEIVTYPGHARAIAFWTRVVRAVDPNARVGEELDHPWGHKVAFAFDNSLPAPC